MAGVIDVLVAAKGSDQARHIADVIAKVEDLRIQDIAQVFSDYKQSLTQTESPDVVILSRDFDDLETAASLANASAQPPVVLLLVADAEEASQDVYQMAMRLGARGVLIQPLAPLQVADAIYKAVDARQQQQAIAPAQPKQAQPSGGESPAEVWTVFSTKGGVGKTTIVTNLGVTLAQQTSSRVALWDLDLQFGNLALNLNVKPRRSLREIIDEINSLDSDLLASYMVQHESGIVVLPSFEQPEYAELMTAQHVQSILSILSQEYDYVLIDSPSFFSDSIMAALDASKQVLLTAALDLGTIRNLKSCLAIMDSLEYSRSRVKLVLNKASRRYGVTPSDLEATLDMTIAASIPTDEKRVVTAINQGIPFVSSAPRAAISSSIGELSSYLRGVEQDGAVKRVARSLFRPSAVARGGQG